MTVDTAGGGAVEVWSGDDGDIGLGDFSLAEDGVLARISIDHNVGKWKTNLNEEDRFDSLTVVLLGLVRQRIMWESEMSDEIEGPLCKSNDATTGHPDQTRFPFDKSAVAPGTQTIDCASCPLKEWGSAPKGDAPWCSVLLTMPLLLLMGGADGEPIWMPATFSAQRTGIKPAKSYITQFKANNKPLFSVMTNLTLMPVKTKGRTYAVPQFTRGEVTELDSYPWYFEQYKSMRNFLTAAPRTDEEDLAALEGSTDPASIIEGTVVSPTAEPHPAAVVTPTVIPPAAPVAPPAPAPVAPPAAAPAPVPPAAPVAPPAAPVAPPAPPAAAPAPRPVPRPAAPPAAAATPSPAPASPAVAPVAPPAAPVAAPIAEAGVAPDDDDLPPF